MNPATNTRTRRREPVVICICGMAGSGKSTVAKKVADQYNLRYFSGGDALMELAMDEGYQSLARGWWESKEGLHFLERRRKDPSFDRVIDDKLLQVAHKGNVVLDSWTMPWLLDKGFKIWLEASPERRAERIAGRDKISYEDALEALNKKERETKAIYKEIYGFNLGDDLEPFDFVLDTESLIADEVYEVLCLVIENLVLK